MDSSSLSTSGSTRRTARGLAPLLLALVSLAVALLLAEGLVRLADRAGVVDLSPTLAEIPPPAEVDEQIDLATSDASRPLYVGDPALHHRMSANWSGTFPEESMAAIGKAQVSIRTNSLGLRAPDVARPKPAGVFRILVLGDSVTFGWGLREQDTYTAQLAGLLAALRPGQRFEVINAGVSGYGTWQEAVWLEQLAAEAEPDLVVLQVHLNDAADNLWGMSQQAEGGDSWLARHSALAQLVQRLALARRLQGSAGGACQRAWNDGQQRVCWERTEELLAGMEKTASARGAPLVLLLSPMRWQVEPGVKDPRAWVDAARYQAELASFARQQNLPLVDPLPAFRSAFTATFQPLFLDVGHPNEAGQRIMAQELYGFLAQAGLLP